MKTKKIYRSSIDGRIVSRAYAEQNPATTYADTVPVGKEPRIKSAEKVLENSEEKEVTE